MNHWITDTRDELARLLTRVNGVVMTMTTTYSASETIPTTRTTASGFV